MQQPGIGDIDHFIDDAIGVFGESQRIRAVLGPHAGMDVIAHLANLMGKSGKGSELPGPPDALDGKPAQFVGDIDELMQREFKRSISRSSKTLPCVNDRRLYFFGVQNSHHLQSRFDGRNLHDGCRQIRLGPAAAARLTTIGKHQFIEPVGSGHAE